MSKTEFLEEFPNFGTLDMREQDALLSYRNMMAVALEVSCVLIWVGIFINVNIYCIQIVPAANNSGHLLDLVTRIVEVKIIAA